MKEKIKIKVSEAKKKVVAELESLASKKKTILIASIKSLPCSQFQEIKKKLIGKAEMRVPKKNLIKLALKDLKQAGFEKLGEYIISDYALLFSDEDAFELSAFLSENKTPAKAREGQISDEDITVESGPTDLPPGPDISALSSLGIKVKVENGKIAILESKLFIKKGEIVSSQKAAVLSKLGMTPFKIGLEPLAAYSEGKFYTNVKIDKEELVNNLKNQFARAIAFAVSIAYPAKETLLFILGKALSHEKALAALIKSDTQTN